MKKIAIICLVILLLAAGALSIYKDHLPTETSKFITAVIVIIGLTCLWYILKLEWRQVEATKRESGLAEKIEKSEQKYRVLFENMLDGVLVFDAETMKVLLGNQTAAEMFGFRSPQEAIGRDIFDFIHPEDRERILRIIAADMFRKGLRPIEEFRTITNDGKEKWIRAFGAMIEYEGKLAGLATFMDITERKRLEKDLQISEMRFRTIMDQAVDMIFVHDIKGRFVDANREACENLGYTKEELLRMSVVDIDPEAIADGKDAFWDIVVEGRRITFESRHKRKDGTYYPVEISIGPIVLGEETLIVASARNITERKRVEETLAKVFEEMRQAKDYMETIFETSVDMVVATDNRGLLTFANRALAEALGYQKEELMTKHMSEFYDTGLERAKDIMGILTRGEELRNYKMKLLTKEGKGILCSLSASLFKDNRGEVIGTIGFLRDITALEEAEENIRKKNKELENFVYTISHDLRAPIVSIQGFSSILISDFQDKLDDTGKRYLARIQANVRQMEILIGDLLAFSRVGRDVGAFENVSSAEIVKSVLDVLGPQLKKRGIKVNVRGKLPVIHCERMRIFQVFENLIQNSIKYMGDAEVPVIEVGYTETDGFYEFYVGDNGIGIDPQYHRRIFQIFQRLKEVDAKGTGVGLATVEKIVEIHGGSVRVESERGKGATFYFTLPRKA